MKTLEQRQDEFLALEKRLEAGIDAVIDLREVAQEIARNWVDGDRYADLNAGISIGAYLAGKLHRLPRGEQGPVIMGLLDAGVSQGEVAKAVGVSRSTVKRAAPTEHGSFDPSSQGDARTIIGGDGRVRRPPQPVAPPIKNVTPLTLDNAIPPEPPRTRPDALTVTVVSEWLSAASMTAMFDSIPAEARKDMQKVIQTAGTRLLGLSELLYREVIRPTNDTRFAAQQRVLSKAFPQKSRS